MKKQMTRSKTNLIRLRKLFLERLEARAVFAGFGPTDGAYFVEPWVGSYSSVAIQPNDQQIIAAGSSEIAPGKGLKLARYDGNGSVDPTYGVNGFVTPSNTISNFIQGGGTVNVDSLGRAVVASSIDGNLGVVRINANGSLDSGFGSGGIASISTSSDSELSMSLGIQSDGSVIVGGLTPNGATGPVNATSILAGFSPSGVAKTGVGGFGNVTDGVASGFTLNSFGGGYASFHSTVIQPDTKIIAVGTYSPEHSSQGTSIVARFLPNGLLDTSFNGSGYSVFSPPGVQMTTGVYSSSRGMVALQPDGKILITGRAGSDAIVARYLSSGTLDPSFGNGLGYTLLDVDGSTTQTNESGDCVTLQPDGKILVVGYVSFPTDATWAIGAYRLNSDGILDSSFGGAGNKVSGRMAFAPGYLIANQVAVRSDGSIIVAGYYFDGISKSNSPMLMRFFRDAIPAIDTKFYVVNDATTNTTYEYTASGGAVENYSLNLGNTAPRGAASTAVGNQVWVVDANKNVYVYNESGVLRGSWAASGLNSNAQVEGITTDGTDIWLVDNKQDRVYKYTGAASRMSGSQSPASSFNLSTSNTSPKDLVTDGTSIWVVNDSSTDKVFKYSLTGSLIGSWTISTPGASSPTGITLNPASPSELWIVDNGTDKVDQYDAAAGLTSGSLSASSSFALAAGNTNPQGIADPPVGDSVQMASTLMAPLAISKASDIAVSQISDEFAPSHSGITFETDRTNRQQSLFARQSTNNLDQFTSQQTIQPSLNENRRSSQTKRLVGTTDDIFSNWSSVDLKDFDM